MRICLNMRTVISLLITLFFVSTFNITTSFAQDSPQWQLPDGARARLGKGIITEIVYSPDGSRLAVAGGIGIWIYDAVTGDELSLLTGHNGDVRCVAFSPDSSILASASLQEVRLWDVTTGTLRNAITRAHTNISTDWINGVAFSPDGTDTCNWGLA